MQNYAQFTRGSVWGKYLSRGLAVLMCWGLLHRPGTAAEAPDCQGVVRYVLGASDIQTRTRYGLVLMGGGPDVAQAFRWLAQRAGGGDLVILRSSGGDGYQEYLYRQIGGFNRVTTLVIDSRARAACPQVLETLRQAEAVFLAGGDQSEYYRFWNDTPLENTLQDLARIKRIPIGGTSAGLAVLGEWVYTAENDTILSAEALKNPFDRRVTLRSDFLSLPLMKNILTDSHFAERKRQGRLMAFMARAVTQGWPDILGLGVDEATALLVADNGDAEVVGQGAVWLFRAHGKGPEVCKPEQPLTWLRQRRALQVGRFRAGERFKLGSRQFLQQKSRFKFGSLDRGQIQNFD